MLCGDSLEFCWSLRACFPWGSPFRRKQWDRVWAFRAKSCEASGRVRDYRGEPRWECLFLEVGIVFWRLYCVAHWFVEEKGCLIHLISAGLGPKWRSFWWESCFEYVGFDDVSFALRCAGRCWSATRESTSDLDLHLATVDSVVLKMISSTIVITYCQVDTLIPDTTAYVVSVIDCCLLEVQRWNHCVVNQISVQTAGCSVGYRSDIATILTILSLWGCVCAFYHQSWSFLFYFRLSLIGIFISYFQSFSLWLVCLWRTAYITSIESSRLNEVVLLVKVGKVFSLGREQDCRGFLFCDHTIEASFIFFLTLVFFTWCSRSEHCKVV